MNINDRIEQTHGMLKLLAAHGYDNFPIYEQLKHNLFEDAELLVKAIQKGRRQDQDDLRRARSEARKAEKANV